MNLIQKSLYLTACGCLMLALDAHAQDSKVLWPNTGNTPTVRYGEKAFKTTTTPDAITLSFSDVANSDDYTLLDLGVVDLKEYSAGGYLEVEAELDQPILRLGLDIGEHANFWVTRQRVEGEALLQTGTQTYRFYLDSIAPQRAAAARDALYLIIHDLGREARGAATLKIRRITLHPPTNDWQEQKKKVYTTQYRWPQNERIEPLYYEHLQNAVDWAPISSSPLLKSLSLDGVWKKKFFGEKTWDTTFLADERFAAPDFSDADWTNASIPEAPTPNQPGGHFWYRRNFDLSDAPGDRYFLRLDDLADDARIYINGKLVGTQVSTDKRLMWIVENGSRYVVGTPPKKAARHQIFERIGVEFPFDSNAIPEDKNRLLLPIHAGEYSWPLAYDVTSYLRPGRNTIAVRVYGNPVRGWWIFRQPSDRSAQNIYGLLGTVSLATLPDARIEDLTYATPQTVESDGLASHRFDCRLSTSASQRAKSVNFICDGARQTVPVETGKTPSATFKLPAAFATHQVQAELVGADGKVFDARTLSFHGTVIETRNGRLLVNGEPFLVRGINSNIGVEFDKERAVTRQEYLRLLALYQRLGINTIRLENAQPWHLQEALRHGMMVMPTAVAGSTDWSLTALGDLQNPDYRLATDRQRNAPILLREASNILMWNGANELHHTPGYEDRPIVAKYLTEIQNAFHETDPYKRPVTFANLDLWRGNWFFTQGQDVIGWNVYEPAAEFTRDAPQVFAESPNRPFIFTEWGTVKGKADRVGKEDAWEADMRAKWNLISTAPQSAGGFLFPHHGELEDERGRTFLRSLYLPYKLEKTAQGYHFTNTTKAAMRAVSFQLSGGQLPARSEVATLLPGASCQLPPSDATTLQINYDSHHGLKHSFVETLLP